MGGSGDTVGTWATCSTGSSDLATRSHELAVTSRRRVELGFDSKIAIGIKRGVEVFSINEYLVSSHAFLDEYSKL